MQTALVNRFGLAALAGWSLKTGTLLESIDEERSDARRREVFEKALEESSPTDLVDAIIDALSCHPSEAERGALKQRWMATIAESDAEASSLVLDLARRFELDDDERETLLESCLRRLVALDDIDSRNELVAYMALLDPTDPVADDISRVVADRSLRYATGTLAAIDARPKTPLWIANSDQALSRLLHGEARDRGRAWSELVAFPGDGQWRAVARGRLSQLLDTSCRMHAGRVLCCFEPTESERREASAVLSEAVFTVPDYEIVDGLEIIVELSTPSDRMTRFAPLFSQLTHYEANRVLSSIRQRCTWATWSSLVPELPPIRLGESARS